MKGCCLADIHNSIVTVKALEGGEGLQSHLAGMGIITGMKIHVIRNDGRGPIIVKVHTTRIAIGRTMARKIVVSGDQDGKQGRA